MQLIYLQFFLGFASTVLAIPRPTPTPTLHPQLLVVRQTTTATASQSIPTGEFITTEQFTIPGQTDSYGTRHPQTIKIAVPTCIQTITPDKNGYVPPGTCGALYDYYPSFVAAVVASAVFGVLTIAHITQAAIFKKKFCWVIIMGSLWEFGAFSTRALSTKYQQNTTIELIASIFVLLAPLWVNAFAYMVLARTIQLFHPSQSVVHISASFLSVAFVALDFISFVIQLVGGSYAGPTAPVDQQMKGVHIYMGGIGLQQFFICVLIFLAVIFHRQMNQYNAMGSGKEGWKKLLWTLYASLGFISIRILFRLIEFSGGNTSSNPFPFHEAYFYALEAGPMFLAILVFNVNHPGKILVGPGAELPGLWKMVKRLFRKGRGNKTGVDDDGEELISEYAKLGKGRDLPM